ncbi:hypothetical protein J6590_037623 [Homalodisca vitripennis]|nr:hypothetical protein J6590_037623 [Homalodisca vitripennis]
MARCVKMERQEKLHSRAAQLDKQIKVLIDDSVALLKTRMAELGINASCPTDLLSKAKEIVLRHKELQARVAKLQLQVQENITDWYFYYVINTSSPTNLLFSTKEIVLYHKELLQGKVLIAGWPPDRETGDKPAIFL